jgi:hypothetical protein
MAGEKERVEAYLDTIHRFEPEIAFTDANAWGTSAAVSLKRIADSLSFLDQINDHLRSIRTLLEEEIAYRRARG